MGKVLSAVQRKFPSGNGQNKHLALNSSAGVHQYHHRGPPARWRDPTGAAGQRRLLSLAPFPTKEPHFATELRVIGTNLWKLSLGVIHILEPQKTCYQDSWENYRFEVLWRALPVQLWLIFMGAIVLKLSALSQKLGNQHPVQGSGSKSTAALLIASFQSTNVWKFPEDNLWNSDQKYEVIFDW